MRRYVGVVLSAWFAVSLTMAEAVPSLAQTGYPYPGSRSGYSGDAGTPPDASSPYPSEPPSGDSHDSPSGLSGYTPDQSESRALTDYLTKHRLPLVGAQVLQRSDGQRQVVLYGYVGSEFGKSDAVTKTRRFLGDSSVRVDNQITVHPELLAANHPTANSGYTGNPGSSNPEYASNPGYSSNPGDENQPGTSTPYPGAQSYLDQRNQAANNPYQQQLSSIMPLIGLLGMLGAGVMGGSGGLSFGGSNLFGLPLGSSGYGASPYASNPYSSPYGGSPYASSPYGAPPAGSPYGGSPYGYGGSPYGSSPYGPGGNPYP